MYLKEHYLQTVYLKHSLLINYASVSASEYK